MSLPFDIARCVQYLCPMRDFCQRFTQRNMGGPRTPYAAPDDWTDNGCPDLILTDRGTEIYGAQLSALAAELRRDEEPLV